MMKSCLAYTAYPSMPRTSPRSAPPCAELPERLGAYRVTRLLARGAGAAVYLAAMPSSPRLFALKAVRKPAMADLSRLRREASVAAGLRHANIVAVYGYQEDQRHGFIIMEHVAGGPLAERLKAGPVAPAQAVDWMCQ